MGGIKHGDIIVSLKTSDGYEREEGDILKVGTKDGGSIGYISHRHDKTMSVGGSLSLHDGFRYATENEIDSYNRGARTLKEVTETVNVEIY